MAQPLPPGHGPLPAGLAGTPDPRFTEDASVTGQRNTGLGAAAAGAAPLSTGAAAGATAVDPMDTLPTARPVFLRQLSDAAREGLITQERKAELRASSLAESCDLPPIMPSLLRQISTAAKEGEISREERAQMKRSVLAGDAAALLEQLSDRPVGSAHIKVQCFSGTAGRCGLRYAAVGRLTDTALRALSAVAPPPDQRAVSRVGGRRGAARARLRG